MLPRRQSSPIPPGELVREAEQSGERRYSTNHLWFARDGRSVTVGATRQLTRILTWVNSIELPRPETVLEKGDELAVIDSQKAVVSVTAPVRLEVQSVNDELMCDPMLIRIDPLGRGWLVRGAVSNTGWEELMLSEGEV